jgi:hypothetical protein
MELSIRHTAYVNLHLAPGIRYMVTWLHGYMVTWVHGYMGTWVHGYRKNYFFIHKSTKTIAKKGGIV